MRGGGGGGWSFNVAVPLKPVWFAAQWMRAKASTHSTRSTSSTSTSTRFKSSSNLKQTLIRLGPVYIKLGQYMASRTDVFTPEMTAGLEDLFDNATDAKRMSAGKLRRVVQAHLESRRLGLNVDDVIDIDETPLAVASVSQVHRVRMKRYPDEALVMKVVRPEVRRGIREDISALRFAINAVMGLCRATRTDNTDVFRSLTDTLDVIDHCEQSLLSETDLRIEAANMKILHETFAWSPTVRVPKIVPALATETFLVMEYVHGERFDPYDNRAHARERDRVRREFLTVLSVSAARSGVFHGDLHAGNFLIESLYPLRIALLDTGSLVRDLPTMRADMVLDIAQVFVLSQVSVSAPQAAQAVLPAQIVDLLVDHGLVAVDSSVGHAQLERLVGLSLDVMRRYQRYQRYQSRTRSRTDPSLLTALLDSVVHDEVLCPDGKAPVLQFRYHPSLVTLGRSMLLLDAALGAT